ncbi:RagB/SusD family nutrient uptake outer membrane protein [Viscerimonas tarda]
MKKGIYSVALFALFAVAFSSCEDEEEQTLITPPATSAEAEALANAVYGPLQTLSSSYSFLVESATETTVSFEGEDNVEGPLVSQFDIKPDNWYAVKVFNRLYTSIGAANLAIEQIGATVVSDELNKEGKDLLIARAKFIRGYNYFQLVQLYGEVPLILSSSATEADKTTRKSIDDVYNQVVSDLKAAIPALPEVDANNKSNPSQLAAKTILAKAYLTWGQKPLSQSEVAAIATSRVDPEKPAIDHEKLHTALAYANEVINSKKYILLSDFNKIWGVPNENNAEVIFSIHHDGDGIDAQGNHQTHCGFTFPTDERAFPHIQYADITLENAIPASDTRKLYSYVSNVTYSNGEIDTLTWPLSVVRPGKWIHRETDGINKAEGISTQLNNIDHIDFRLAEVYLIKAEAQFFLGDSDKGLAAINELRTRAKVTKLSAVTVQDLYNEWGYEFAFEQKHWINLVRWRTLISSVLNKVPNYEYYKSAYNDETAFNTLPKADASRFTFYSRIYKHLHAKTTNINGHQYRFPVPLSERGNDLGIRPQNPGY